MINLMEKILKEKLPRLVEKDACLDFLKFSTPSSGKTLNDKVIFFVFKREEKEPFLCIKTARHYGAKEAIIRNFENLGKLNKLIRDGACSDMFAKALHLHDDGENIFSVETACFGKKVEPISKNFKIILKDYTSFQKHCLKKEKDFIPDLRAFGEELIKRGKFEKKDEKSLLNYFDNFSFGKKSVIPKVIQHGDMTLDNILFTPKGLCIIDYDYVGVSYLPGFDLFNFFARHNSSLLPEGNSYLAEYFDAMGVETSDIKPIFFLAYLSEIIFKKSYLLKKATAPVLIKNFEEILSS